MSPLFQQIIEAYHDHTNVSGRRPAYIVMHPDLWSQICADLEPWNRGYISRDGNEIFGSQVIQDLALERDEFFCANEVSQWDGRPMKFVVAPPRRVTWPVDPNESPMSDLIEVTIP